MTTTCIYHSRDLDGWMSAAIVKLYYQTIKLIGWDYGQPLPELDINSHVVMVDISLPKGAMVEISLVNGLTWIDHHISAINEMGGVRNLWGGIQAIDRAACELTWEYLFPKVKMPEIVRLLGRYDCFGHKGTDEEKKVLIFQYAARASLRNPEECFKALHEVTDAHIEGWLNIGEGIYSYLCTEARQKYDKRFDIIIDGFKFGCVNDWRLNPINFGIEYHNDGYDGFACFWYENGQFSYSLYNDNGLVDCSVLAKNKGGGGHKGASGFRTTKILK